jgi:hypothetical protein
VAQEWALEIDGKQEVRRASCAEIWEAHLPQWRPRIRAVTGRTTDTLPALLGQGKKYDLIFIDAGHDLSSVAHDLAYSTMLLAPGGAILMDDYAPLEPFGLGTCVVASHVQRFFEKVEIFPTEGVIFGGTDTPGSPRGMLLLSGMKATPQFHRARLLWWRFAGAVLDLCYRKPLFPLSTK